MAKLNTKIVMLKGEQGKDGTTIKSIEKSASSGLVDTYTITLTNGSKFSFNVNNGKGISNIEKTGTSGLDDTYTFTYNDGTTSTFTVTNGEGIQNLKVGGRNLIIKRDLVNGWIAHSTGNFFTDPNYACTDYIPVKSGEIVTVSWRKDKVIDDPWFGLFFYRSDKTFISDLSGQRNENTVIVTEVAPDQCDYLRVYWGGSKDEKVKVERGNIATDWTPAPEDLTDTPISNSDIDTILNS